MKNKMKRLFILLPTILLVVSCKKFVDVDQPRYQLTSDEVFADSADASRAVVGTYVTIMNSPLNICSGGVSMFTGLSSDELYLTVNNPDYTEFYQDAILPDNGTSGGLWSAGYNYIYAVNAAIAGVNSSTGISAGAKTQIIAEARFIRGLVYFQLVNLFGGVPLVTGTGYQVNGLAPRASADAVYGQVITDLQYAEANLGNNTGTNDRPNTLTASALLAKVYLYDSKYDLAQAEAAKVINSGNYHLETDLNNVFLTGSGETIWQLDLLTVKYTWEGLYFVSTSTRSKPRYLITPSLYNSFEAGDQRFGKWIKSNTIGGTAYPFPYKYKNGGLATTATESYVVLRLADQYLIRAEAEANQNDIADALNDLNTIRQRSGLPNAAAPDKASVLTAIVNERRHEFFCEWGNRWFDLKRWNLAMQVLNPLKTNWNTNDEMYPVPITEITTNPNLVQNPGY